MKDDERGLVLTRLHDVEGWSEYIIEVLTRNQPVEPATVEMLEHALGREALRELRECSWSLYEKLHRMRTVLELSIPGPSMAPAAHHV